MHGNVLPWITPLIQEQGFVNAKTLTTRSAKPPSEGQIDPWPLYFPNQVCEPDTMAPPVTHPTSIHYSNLLYKLLSVLLLTGGRSSGGTLLIPQDYLSDTPYPALWGFVRNTLSTSGNSMTSSERPSPEPILKKEAPPSRTGGGDNSGNALEAPNALNKRVSGFPAVLSTRIPEKL